MKVFVTIWFHHHGEDVAAFSTKEKAEEDRRRIAAENWDQKIDSERRKPKDPAVLADTYFDIMGDAPRRPEYFEVCEVELDAP